MSAVAWIALDDDRAVVVFAASVAEANRLGDTEDCERAPQFDGYAKDGAVPPLALLAAGWWLECDYCRRRIEDDRAGAVADGNRVYCNARHRTADRRKRRRHEARIKAAVAACAAKFAGLPIFDLRGTGSDATRCEFDFPGRKGLRALWEVGTENLWISTCDIETWKNLREKKP